MHSFLKPVRFLLGFKKGAEFYSFKSNTPEEEMFGKGWPADEVRANLNRS